MGDWLGPKDRDFWHRVEQRYLDWCEKHGIEPYVCRVEGCDNQLPCRKHLVHEL